LPWEIVRPGDKLNLIITVDAFEQGIQLMDQESEEHPDFPA
jgi:hypothetical protein